ncbi:peptide methionine sulfoxide reductase msrA [Vibrio ishigakensis]|uniref:Peptide methionine sulfoxide reductase MsrA n=1 Tax=Vibrio ishigakensis TaxID=1481914 RepID=A0A0B8P6I6_9VIBR|nr:peptide methionine sulfoxide reductase msrA [Vibrio ishigakensis]
MFDKQTMISELEALPGRDTPILSGATHFVNHTDLTVAPANGCQEILLGLGCFWGAERLFWNLEGVISTSVGYAGGFTQNPTYEEVCSGRTGHTEVVRIIYDPSKLSLESLLQVFWEKHDPTQGMRQGNDRGTQYRSAIYTYNDEQQTTAETTLTAYQQLLSQSGIANITTEIKLAGPYYLAEEYHQQYLAKNPNGYCGIGGTGVCFPPQND